jgi:hypothetical protein
VDRFISAFGVPVVLQLIPGHTDIHGNDKVDMMAKQGASLQQSNKPVTYRTAKQIIQQNYREEWMNQWAAGKTGRVVYKNINRPNKNDCE